jgi:hypothetical protein
MCVDVWSASNCSLAGKQPSTLRLFADRPLSFVRLEQHKEESMALERKFIRDRERKVIGSVTTGFPDGVAVVRDKDNRYLGKTSERFETTRDEHGRLVSTNTVDPGLLIGKKK